MISRVLGSHCTAHYDADVDDNADADDDDVEDNIHFPSHHLPVSFI